MVSIIDKTIQIELDLTGEHFSEKYYAIVPPINALSGCLDAQFQLVKSEVEKQTGSDFREILGTGNNKRTLAIELNPTASEWLRNTGIDPLSFEAMYYIQKFRDQFYFFDTANALSDYINNDIVNAILDSPAKMIDTESTRQRMNEIFSSLTMFDKYGSDTSSISSWLIDRNSNTPSLGYCPNRLQVVHNLVGVLQNTERNDLALEVIHRYIGVITNDLSYFSTHRKNLSEKFDVNIEEILLKELRSANAKLRAITG